MCSVDNVHESSKPYLYYVDSDNNSDVYGVVVRKDGSYHCDCKAFRYQSSECKHIAAVREYRAQQQTPQPYLTEDMTYAELARALLSMKNAEVLSATLHDKKCTVVVDLHMRGCAEIKDKDEQKRTFFGE